MDRSRLKGGFWCLTCVCQWYKKAKLIAIHLLQELGRRIGYNLKKQIRSQNHTPYIAFQLLRTELPRILERFANLCKAGRRYTMILWLGYESDRVGRKPSPGIESPDLSMCSNTGCFISWNYPSCPVNVSLQLSRCHLSRWHDRAASADITGESLNATPGIVKVCFVF